MTDDTRSLDAEIETVLVYGAKLREQQRKALAGTDDNRDGQSLECRIRQVDREHRKAIERYEVRVFEC